MAVDPNAVVQEAMRQVQAVLDAVLSEVESPRVPQDMLRRHFEEMGPIQFAEEHGLDEAIHQGVLALTRVRNADRRRNG